MPQPRYPGKLHHHIPSWVQSGALFHLRIRCLPSSPPLTSPDIAPKLMASAQLYHQKNSWYARLFLLMPDHLHAILAFPTETGMSAVIAAWKAFHAKHNGIHWQEGYFDHRLRSDDEVTLKAHYSRMNPVVKKLCECPEDWPWVSEPFKSDPP